MMVTPNKQAAPRDRSQSNTARGFNRSVQDRPRRNAAQSGAPSQNRGQTQTRKLPQDRQKLPNHRQQPKGQHPVQSRQTRPSQMQGAHPGQRQRPVQAPPRASANQTSSVAKRARTQTPANRRAARARRRIDPRQVEIQRKRKEAHKFYMRKRRRNAFRVFLGRFVIFLAMFALIFSSAVGVILLRYYSYEKPDGEILYQIGADGEVDTTSHTLKRSSIMIDDTLYINITEIALLCEFTTTGDLDEIRLISKNESNDNVKLTLDSPVVVINGNPVRLSAPVFRSGEAIYVPYEFFTSYVTGISVTYDEEKSKVTIVREQIGMTETKLNKPSEPIYADICFTLKYAPITDNIPEDSLDPDIRIATEPKPATDTSQN